MATNFAFSVHIAKGTPPHDHSKPNGCNLLVFEGVIPSWGELVSYEAAILRDGARAFDISTYSVGVVTLPDGRLWMTFQMWDFKVDSIVDHEYRLEAYFHLR